MPKAKRCCFQSLDFQYLIPVFFLSFSSESLDDQKIDIEDAATKARVAFTLRAQHGAMVLLNRTDGSALASYGLTSK